MMLHDINTPIKRQKRKCLGRGPGCKKGKTCGRGEKGQGSRSGARCRHTYEGGQFRLFQKLPTRGFTRGRFQKKLDSINLYQIHQLFEEGDIVNVATLQEKGFLPNRCHGLKVLGEGILTKKVTIEADHFSEIAKEKLDQAKITYIQN